jgi:AMIN domain
MRCAAASRTGIVVLVGTLVASSFRLRAERSGGLAEALAEAVSWKTVLAVDLPPKGGSYANALRSVRVEPTDGNGETRVVIEANGALPEPTNGTALSPPRIYLDFINVFPLRTVEPLSPNSVVARIRVAEHGASPLVTRVVVDLMKESQYRIDASAHAQGRVIVIIATTPPPNISTANVKPPGAGTTQYATRVATALMRLHTLKPLLEAIDRRAEGVPGDLNAAVKQFDDIGTLLIAVKPPQSRASTHALLLRTCTLGARAARLRESAAGNQDAASGWDAASAAAGALLMLERANGELRQGKR